MRCFLRVINNLNTRRRIAEERVRELLHPIPHPLLARMVANKPDGNCFRQCVFPASSLERVFALSRFRTLAAPLFYFA
jgi:hypothetical protein